jgi:hypothetical protein
MCRNWLRDRPEKVIVVVSHSAFLRLGVTMDGFANGDYRIYEFANQGDRLVQRPDTVERGGGMGLSSTMTRKPEPSDFEEEDDVEPSPLALEGVATESPPN